jgi:adenylate kinase family enzyme
MEVDAIKGLHFNLLLIKEKIMFTKHHLDSVFNSVLTRPFIYVVSDSIMKDWQEKQKEQSLEVIDNQIKQLQETRKSIEDYYNTSNKLDNIKEEKEVA